MQKKKKYTRKRLQKEHVNGWKNALVRQHLSLPFHGLRGGGGGPRRGAEGVGGEM